MEFGKLLVMGELPSFNNPAAHFLSLVVYIFGGWELPGEVTPMPALPGYRRANDGDAVRLTNT